MRLFIGLIESGGSHHGFFNGLVAAVAVPLFFILLTLHMCTGWP